MAAWGSGAPSRILNRNGAFLSGRSALQAADGSLVIDEFEVINSCQNRIGRVLGYCVREFLDDSCIIALGRTASGGARNPWLTRRDSVL